MNAAHLHLLVNHLPIFGVYFALPLLLWAWWRRERILMGAPVALLVAAAVGVFVADQSGERAEEQVEHLPGVSEAAIYTHEELAEVSVVLTGIAGAVGVAALLLTRRRAGPLPHWAAAGPLLATGAAAVSLGLTGLSGGQIHHPEVREGVGATVIAAMAGEEGRHEAAEDPDEEAREHAGRDDEE